MTPAFDSWQAFLAMGVHAFHVWTSVALTVGSMLILAGLIIYQQKKCEQRVRKQFQLSSSIQDEAPNDDNNQYQ